MELTAHLGIIAGHDLVIDRAHPVIGSGKYSTLCSAELRVVASAALTEAFSELIPQFEHSTQQRVIASFGSSVGNTSDSIKARLERGEPADLVILFRPGLDQLISAAPRARDRVSSSVPRLSA